MLDRGFSPSAAAAIDPTTVIQSQLSAVPPDARLPQPRLDRPAPRKANATPTSNAQIDVLDPGAAPQPPGSTAGGVPVPPPLEPVERADPVEPLPVDPVDPAPDDPVELADPVEPLELPELPELPPVVAGANPPTRVTVE